MRKTKTYNNIRKIPKPPSILELIKRPIIRNDQYDEWLNKMTDKEISLFEKECKKECKREKIPILNISTSLISKYIDQSILYNILTQCNTKDTSHHIMK